MVERLIHTFQIGGNGFSLPLNESGFTYYLSKRRFINAEGNLEFSANAANAETVTIDSKVYTFKTVLTTADGDVLIGSDAEASLDNLMAAINLGLGTGVFYGVLTTLHPTVVARPISTTRIRVDAKLGGSAANSIATTETLANGDWLGQTTLVNGAFLDAKQDNNPPMALPLTAIDGTNYTFITEDNGITFIDNREYFTNWRFTCLLAQEIVVSGAPLGSRKQLKTDQPFPVLTREFNIGLTRTERGKTIREGYVAGTKVELIFINNAWRGSFVSGPSVRGIGDF